MKRKDQSRTELWVGIIAILCSVLCIPTCLLALVVIGYGVAGEEVSLFSGSVTVGSEAPDFELGTLAGGTFRLSQHRGQPIVLSFGTTWCPSCQAELPVLQGLHRKYPELLIILVDSQEEDRLVRANVTERKVTFPVGLDRDGAVARQYRVNVIPMVFFVDREGVVQARYVGVLSDENIEASLIAVGVDP